jgi:lysyl-tRNA synthetase class 2
MLEFYQAYATYTDLMELTEQLLGWLASELKGTKVLTYQELQINLEPPFARITVKESLAKALGVDVEQLGRRDDLLKLADQHNVSVSDVWESGKVLMALFEEKVEASLIQPTFVYDFPLDVSPLSRKKEGQDDLVDRFELYICGRELANAFSELNDPDDQRDRFTAQMEAKAKGDEEAMPFDDDYIRALEYGMPPAAGEGIGIDRLVMLFADVPSIRDVILFPLLKPER